MRETEEMIEGLPIPNLGFVSLTGKFQSHVIRAGIASPSTQCLIIRSSNSLMISASSKTCPHLERKRSLSMTLGVSSLHHNAATGSRTRSESFLEISDACFFLDQSLWSPPQAINSFAASKFEARSILVLSGYVDRQLIPNF